MCILDKVPEYERGREEPWSLQPDPSQLQAVSPLSITAGRQIDESWKCKNIVSAIEAPLTHICPLLFPLKLPREEIACALGDSCPSVAVYEDGAGLGERQRAVLWFGCIRRLLG